jgi:hypothetical protein
MADTFKMADIFKIAARYGFLDLKDSSIKTADTLIDMAQSI